MQETNDYQLHPIGFIESPIKDRRDAPKQGYESAPDVWLTVNDEFAEALDGIGPDDELVLITWFHQSRRDVLSVHPRGDKNNPVTGVFATRSPDRPNPLGLHRVKVREIGRAHV